jgi:predicted kinase
MMTENKKQPTVYLICGFIGAGKTTFSKKLAEETGAVRITKDEWLIHIFGNSPLIDHYDEYNSRIIEIATNMAFEFVARGVDVIIDEGFWPKAQRAEIVKRVESAGAKPVVYYVESPVELMRARTIKRSKNPTKDSFEISEEMFNSYLQYWQAPDESEDVIVIKSSEL